MFQNQKTIFRQHLLLYDPIWDIRNVLEWIRRACKDVIILCFGPFYKGKNIHTPNGHVVLYLEFCSHRLGESNTSWKLVDVSGILTPSRYTFVTVTTCPTE